MRSADLAKALLSVAFAAGADAALACACLPQTPDEVTQLNALIFFGHIVEVDQRTGKATFAVHARYKGAARDRVTIAFENAAPPPTDGPHVISSCAMRFNAGEVHMIFAGYKNAARDGVFIANSCGMASYNSAPKLFLPALDALARDAAAGSR
jgi:hypothetical protein